MSYIKNLMKSTQFFVEDMAAEFLPIAKPVKESVQKLITEAKSAYSNGSAKSATNIIGKMPYFNDVSQIVKNSFTGVMTGNIYTRYGMDLEQQFEMSGYNMLTENESEEGESALTGSDSVVGDDTKLIAQATVDSAKASSEASAKTANKLHIDNRLFFTEFKHEMGQHLENTNNAIGALANFNDTYMKQYVDQSMKYYTDSLSALNDIRRAVMPAEGQGINGNNQRELNWVDKLNNGDLMGAGKSMLGKMAGHYDNIGILGLAQTLASMYLPIYAQSPGQMLLDAGKWGLNKALKLGGFTDLQKKLMKPGTMMNKIAEMMSLSDNGFMRSTGEALRLKNEKASRYMPKSNYNGNEIAKWDLESKTALTVVIPQYLATIASGITGLDEKFYDASKNDWFTREEMTKDFRKGEPNSKDIENSMSNLILKHFNKKDFGYEGKEDQLKIIVDMISKGLIQDSRSLDSLTGMSLNTTKSGAKGLREMIGIAGDEKLEKIFDDKLLTAISDAVYKINMDKDDRDYAAAAYERTLAYGKNFKAFYEGADKNRIGHGSIFAMNNGLYGAMNGKNGKIYDRSNDKIASFFGEDEDSLIKDAEKLKGIYDDGAYVNQEERDKAKLASMSGITDVDWAGLTGKRRKNFIKHFMQMKIGSEAKNNQMAEDHEWFRDAEDLKAFKGDHVFNAKAAIGGTDYNPIVDKLVGEVKDTVSENTDGEMSESDRSKLNQVLGDKSETIKKELAAIDADKSLTDTEKTVRKDKVLKKGASILTDGVASLFKDSKFFKDINGNGQAKSVAKIVGMGMAGIMGANLFGSLMGGMPGIGSIMGAAGWLTPVMLSGLGLGAGIYAAKKGLLSNILGDMKDPGKRKEMMNKFVKSALPDLFLGGTTGIASSMILSHILPFGNVMGPIMGASLGLATGIYSHQSGLMANLFGTDDKGKKGKDAAGQLGRNRWFNFFKTMTAGAVGLGGASMLLKGMGGLPVVGGIMELGGSIISNPIMFAASAVASGILLEKDSIKKKIFGDGAEKNSFTNNLGKWLFGDKKENKEGILSRQFKRFGNYLDKGSKNISTWFKESIIGNVKLAFKPMTESLSKIGKGVITAFMGGWDKLSDKMKESLDKGFIKSLATSFEEKVINPISSKISGFFGFFFKTIGGIASAPFKMMSRLFAGETYAQHKEKNARKFEIKDRLEDAADRARKTGSRMRSAIFGKGGSSDDLSNIYGMGKRNGPSRAGILGIRKEVKSEAKAENTDDRFISQTDGKNGMFKIGDSTMKESGCAVACMTMVVAKLKKDDDIQAVDIAKEAIPYKVRGDGIRPEFFGSMAKTFKLDLTRVKAVDLDEESMLKSVKKGHRIIALMEKSYNGIGRHYVFIKNSKGHNIIFDDPMTGPDKISNIHLFNKNAIEYFVFIASNKKRGISIDTIMPKAEKAAAALNSAVDDATGSDNSSGGNEEKEPETVKELIEKSIGSTVKDHLGKALDMVGLSSVKNIILGGGKLAYNAIVDRITDKGKESAEESIEKAKTPDEKKEEKIDPKLEYDNSPVLNEPAPKKEEETKEKSKMYESFESFFAEYSKSFDTNDKTLNKIHKSIMKQTNGVAYNLEYIKRLLVKHIGDLADASKPDKEGFFNFKMKGFRSGIGGFFLNAMDNMSGWMKGLFNFKNSPILNGVKKAASAFGEGLTSLTSKMYNGVKGFTGKVVTGTLKVVDKLTLGVGSFLTKGLPNLLKTTLVDPIKGVFKAFSENISKFTGLITDTLSDFRKATSRVIGDIYSMATTSIATLGKMTLGGVVGLGKMLFSGITESKIGKKILDGVGGLFGGALKGIGNMFGITKIFSSIGTKVSGFLGPKKVVVQGGWIDLVKKVEGVGAVGAVDQDTYNSVASSTDAAGSVKDSIANADEPNGKNPTGKIVQATKASEPNDTDIRKSDKEQDDRNKLQDDAFKTIIEKLGGGAAAETAANRNKNGKPTVNDADGDGIPDGKEEKKGGGFLSTMFGMLAASSVGKFASKIFTKLGLKGLGTRIAGTRLGAAIGSRLAGKSAGQLLKGGAKGLGKLAGVATLASMAGGWGIEKLGQGTSALGFKDAGEKMQHAGEKVATPGRAVMETVTKPVTDFFGVSMPTTDAFTDQAAKRAFWGTAKNRILKPGMQSILEKNLIKSSKGGLAAAEDMLKSDAVKKYLISRGVDLKKYGINAGLTATTEKTAKLVAETEAGSMLKKLFNAKAVKKYVMKHMGKDMSEAAVEQLTKELTKAASRNIAKKGGIAALKSALVYIPYVNIISIVTFFLIDFGWGWYKAKDYMKVEKPNKLMKFVAGMTNALQGTISSLSPFLLFIALIPTEIITQIIWKWGLKIFGSPDDEREYNKQREKFLEKEAKKQKTDENKRRSKAKLYDKIKDPNDKAALDSFTFKHSTYSVVGDEITEHDQKIVRNKMVDYFMGDRKTESGMDATTFKEIMDKQNGKNNSNGKLDTRGWYNMSKIWDPFRIDTKTLTDNTRYRETLSKDAMLDFAALSNAMSNYDIAGYSYAEVGCGPEALFNVYTSYGLKPDRKYLARVASFYKNYIQSGQGIPWKYLVDYAVFDGFCVKVLRPSAADVTNAIFAYGYKCILLTQNPDGSAHYIAATNATSKGNIVIVDPLRRGGLDEDGKTGRIGIGQSYIGKNDTKFWNNVIGAIAIAPKAEGKLGYDSKWYQLYPNAKELIQKNPTGFKFSEVGLFMDAPTMFEARAWADGRFNPDANKGKPANYQMFREMSRGALKKYGLEGQYTEDQIKGMVLRDIYDNSGNQSSGDNKYILYKDGKGKTTLGMANIGREGGIPVAMNSYMGSGGNRKIEMYDPTTKMKRYMTVNEDDPYFKTDKTMRVGVTPLFGSNDQYSYVYAPNELREKIAKIKPSKYVVDDQGGYGSKRPNFITSSMRSSVNALNGSLDSYDNAKVAVVNNTKIKEVVKMSGVEDLLGSLNNKFDAMIQIMTALVANSSMSKETMAAVAGAIQGMANKPSSNSDFDGFMSEMSNMSR